MDKADRKQVGGAALPTDGEGADNICEEAEVTTQELALPAKKSPRCGHTETHSNPAARRAVSGRQRDGLSAITHEQRALCISDWVRGQNIFYLCPLVESQFYMFLLSPLALCVSNRVRGQNSFYFGSFIGYVFVHSLPLALCI